MRPHQLRATCCLVVLTLILGLSPAYAMLPAGPGSRPPTLPPAGADGPIDYVVVTVPPLANEFEHLARAHSRAGLASAVVSLAAIRAAYPGGVDDPERIRLFLADAHAAWGTRWVLLGGDDSLLPMRRVTVHSALGSFLLPTDQYYACLEGTWNADGDGLWGELPGPADPGDEVDLTPELFVGRAPVREAKEARLFVRKTLAARPGPHEDAERSALLAADELLPGLDGAQLLEPLRPLLEAAGYVHVTRLYERFELWPGSYPESRQALIDSLDAGYDLAVLSGAGGPGVLIAGDDVRDRFTSQDALALTNGRRLTHVYVQSGYTNDPDSAPSVGAGLVLAPAGGALSVIGATRQQFVVASHAFMDTYFGHALGTPGTSLGEALARTVDESQRELAPLTDDVRLTTLGTVLLGAPALELRPEGGPVARLRTKPSGDRSPLAAESQLGLSLALAAPVPNPATGGTRFGIAIPRDLEGSRFSLTVYDPAGRRVRILAQGVAQAGRRSVDWDLKGEDGTRVGAGLYLTRLSAGDKAVTTRVLVLP